MAINVDISKITGINQVGNSYQRKSAVPLDYFSFFNTKVEAETYAASNPVAYVGQYLAYADENQDGKIVACIIENAAGSLREVGAVNPDNKTIEVNAEGAIALFGANNAQNGTLPMLEDGELVWKTLEDIGAGDGNDNTTYEFDFDDQKITITPKFNGQPIMEGEGEEAKAVVYELDLSDFVTTEELTDVVGKAAVGEEAATGLYKAIADALQEAKEYVDETNTEYHLEYDSDEKKIKLVDGQGEMNIDATPFIKDGMLKNVEYNVDDNTLTFTWNTDAEEQTDSVVLSDIIEPYTAGNGLELKGNEFSVKIDANSETFLTVGENGVKLAGVQDAINEALEAANDYADSLEHENTTYTLEADDDLKLVFTSSDENDPKEIALNAYNKTAIDDFLYNGKYSTIIDGQLTDVTSNIAEADRANSRLITPTEMAKLAALVIDNSGNVGMSGTISADNVVGLNEAISAMVTGQGDNQLHIAPGAQVNVIESVVAAEKAKITAVTTDKQVVINDSGLVELIEAAQAKADAAHTAAIDNGLTLVEHNSLIDGLTKTIGGNVKEIAVLKAHDEEHQSQFKALLELTESNGSEINTIKADLTSLATKKELSELRVVVNTIDTNIDTLDSNIRTVANSKANADDVYTKDEIAAITGKVAEGKTIVGMIADATYDDNAIKNLIQGNTKAIEDLAGGAVKNNTEAIESLTKKVGNLSNIMNFVGAKDAVPEDNTGYESGDVIIVDDQEYVFDGSAWQAFGDASVNGALISALDKRVEANEDAIKLINDAEKGILASIPEATDALLGLISYDNKSIKKNENKQLYVAEVSTDLLVQGTKTMYLCAGDSTYFTDEVE